MKTFMTIAAVTLLVAITNVGAPGTAEAGFLDAMKQATGQQAVKPASGSIQKN